MEKVAQEEAATALEKVSPELKEAKRKRKKLSYMEQREWESIEDEIEAQEEKLTAAAEAVASSGDDYEKVQEHFKEQETLEAELEAKMERWEELSLKVEALE